MVQLFGFLGTGSIATHFANRLSGFNVKLLGYRNKDMAHPTFDETYHGIEGLKHVLKESDYIIITLPLNRLTNQLLTYELLSLMKKDALLINVGRGEVICQDALIKLLQEDKIRGAGLDVVYPEPLNKDNPLWQMSNVYITPHNAPSSIHMLERLYKLVDTNLTNYKENKTQQNTIKITN